VIAANRLIIDSSVLLGAVLAILFLVILPGDSVRDRLVTWMNASNRSCAYIDNEDRAPAAVFGAPVGFARRADERALVSCEYMGSSTYYFRFESHAAMDAALRAYPVVFRLRPCVLDQELFTGDVLFDMPLSPMCHRLHGRIRGSTRYAGA
jgi:hypothetical protein